MWNPVYFNYGIAVHGAGNVPQYPASHGCVRIPMHVGNYFPSLVAKGDQIFVFDGVKEPEAYGAQVPPFNTPDPSYTHDDVDHHHDDDAPAATTRPPDTPGAHPASSAADRRRRPTTPTTVGQGGGAGVPTSTP